jgi:ParB family transcriptional regulator, chromosome partitioning protein
MDNLPNIVPMRDRRYEEVTLDKIKVINTRNRDQEQFQMNVESIDQMGLLKPIRVNDKFLDKTGFYELICGEGRLLAHRKLGRLTVLAEVVTCSRKDAYLESLIENIARTKPGSMDYARELKRLYDEGWDYAQIGRVALKPENYIRDYIRLVEQGEERLIQGVEQGVFPIAFATKVARSENGQIQNVLMDAFDEGIVTTMNFAQARQIIMARARQSKDKKTSNEDYSVDQLKQDISEATQAKSSYVREAKSKESRFLTLLTELNAIWQDEAFVQLLVTEKLANRPQLAGDFNYETPTANEELSHV